MRKNLQENRAGDLCPIFAWSREQGSTKISGVAERGATTSHLPEWAANSQACVTVSLRSAKVLFTQVLERNLDTLVVELLIVAAKLIAATGAAVEKLVHHADWRVRLSLKDGRAS